MVVTLLRACVCVNLCDAPPSPFAVHLRYFAQCCRSSNTNGSNTKQIWPGPYRLQLQPVCPLCILDKHVGHVRLRSSGSLARCLLVDGWWCSTVHEERGAAAAAAASCPRRRCAGDSPVPEQTWRSRRPSLRLRTCPAHTQHSRTRRTLCPPVSPPTPSAIKKRAGGTAGRQTCRQARARARRGAAGALTSSIRTGSSRSQRP